MNANGRRFTPIHAGFFDPRSSALISG